MRLICTLLAAGAVTLVATAPAAPMSPPRLIGTVGPGFTISLKKGTARVKTLKAGKYTFVVSDKASIHNFVFEGPGIDRAISAVGFRGTKTVTLTLKRGKYKYYCAPHESSMFGFVTVT
jgi:copper binding plastocyanin/azurin family protein